MSVKRNIPAGTVVLPAAVSMGLLAAALCFAGTAQLMVIKELPVSIAPLLATIPVCSGSLVGGAVFAFFKKERGLLNGLLQGTVFAAVLMLITLSSGGTLSPLQGARIAAAVVCGGIGGFGGLKLREKPRGRGKHLVA